MPDTIFRDALDIYNQLVELNAAVTSGDAGDATAANQAAAIAILGAIADASVAAGATGSISAKLRRATQGLEDLKTLLVLATGEHHIGAVTEPLFVSFGNTTTRPNDTTVYPANGAVGNSDTANQVVMTTFTVSRVADGPVMIRKGRIKATATSIESVYRGKRIALDLFSATFTPLAGDKAAYTCDAANYLGTMTGTFKQTDLAGAVFSSGATQANLAPDVGSDIICVPASGLLVVYGLMRFLDATASNVASVVFQPILEGIQGHA